MPESDEIAAVVLAAGASRRFGSDKLLCPLTLHGETRPLVAHSLQPWLAAFPQVSVVVAPESAGLRQALASYGDAIRWVVCEDAKQGMGHSFATGIAANRDAAGWLIGLADMPAVPEHAIRGVQAAILAGAPLAAPFRDGRRGHPVGFAYSYRDELLALHGDTGARVILQRDSEQIAHVAIDQDGIFADIDSPQDLNHLTEYHPEKPI